MKVLVVGCANNVWDDAKAAQALCVFDKVYCVKGIGVDWPDRFDVWVTLHPEAMDDYEAKRKKMGYPDGYEIVGPLVSEIGMHGKKGRIARRLSYRYPGMTGSGSSGMFGVKVALDDGATHVVMAGIPMSPERGHYLPNELNLQKQRRTDSWNGRDAFLPGFHKMVPFIKDKTRSMSGFSKKILGYPTPEWLNSGPAPLGNADARDGSQHLEGVRADAR